MNLATHAGLIAGTSVLTIASTGTAGDLDSVIDGIINDSATISGDDSYKMSGLFIYGFTNGEAFTDDTKVGNTDDYAPGVGEASITFEGESGGFSWTFDYNFAGGYYESGFDGLDGDNYDGGAGDFNDYGFWHESDAGWGVGMGQFRSWANKANNVDVADTLAMSNSLVGSFAYSAGGYSDMVFAWYEADQFRGGVQFADSTDTNDAGVDDHEFDMHYRVEFIAMGDWDQTDDFNAAAGQEQVLAFGFGGFEGTADLASLGLAGTADHDFTNYDVTYKMDSMGLHAAFGEIELDVPGADDVEFMTLQASYFVNDSMQAFLTYEDIEFGNGVTPKDLDRTTIGVNYFYSDSCKGTLEYRDGSFDLDAADNDGDSVIAGQVQFTF